MNPVCSSDEPAPFQEERRLKPNSVAPFGHDCESREECSGSVLRCLATAADVSWPIPPAWSTYPKTLLWRPQKWQWAMRVTKILRLTRLQVFLKNAGGRLKAAFDFIDKRDGSFSLILLGNARAANRLVPILSLPSGNAALTFGSKSDQCCDGQALSAGDRQVQFVRQAFRLEDQIESFQSLLLRVCRCSVTSPFRRLARQSRAQCLSESSRSEPIPGQGEGHDRAVVAVRRTRPMLRRSATINCRQCRPVGHFVSEFESSVPRNAHAIDRFTFIPPSPSCSAPQLRCQSSPTAGAFGLLADPALRWQRYDGLDDEARLDIPPVIVGIGKGRGISGAEKNAMASRMVVLPTSPPPRIRLTPLAGCHEKVVMQRKRSIARR